MNNEQVVLPSITDRKNQCHLNKVLGFHNFIQVLQHSEKRWIKNSWGKGDIRYRSQVQILNSRLTKRKARRRKLLLRSLHSLTVMERIRLQEDIENVNREILHLKELRNAAYLPRMRGDRTQGVFRV